MTDKNKKRTIKETVISYIDGIPNWEEEYTEEEYAEIKRMLEEGPKRKVMPYDSPEGTKVIHDKVRGHEEDMENARKYLEIGKIYTVKETKYNSFITFVELKEVPGVLFNSVNFITLND